MPHGPTLRHRSGPEAGNRTTWAARAPEPVPTGAPLGRRRSDPGWRARRRGDDGDGCHPGRGQPRAGLQALCPSAGVTRRAVRAGVPAPAPPAQCRGAGVRPARGHASGLGGGSAGRPGHPQRERSSSWRRRAPDRRVRGLASAGGMAGPCATSRTRPSARWASTANWRSQQCAWLWVVSPACWKPRGCAQPRRAPDRCRRCTCRW